VVGGDGVRLRGAGRARLRRRALVIAALPHIGGSCRVLKIPSQDLVPVECANAGGLAPRLSSSSSHCQCSATRECGFRVAAVWLQFLLFWYTILYHITWMYQVAESWPYCRYQHVLARRGRRPSWPLSYCLRRRQRQCKCKCKGRRKTNDESDVHLLQR
jgi:hypothetical protein